MTNAFRLLPRELTLEIDAVLRIHQGTTIQVYAEAEKLRQRHAELNIALEDILHRLVEDSGKYQVAVAFNPDEAANALMNNGDCKAQVLQ